MASFATAKVSKCFTALVPARVTGCSFACIKYYIPHMHNSLAANSMHMCHDLILVKASDGERSVIHQDLYKRFQKHSSIYIVKTGSYCLTRHLSV